ncbi:MAG TPA: hypothetical protein VK023_00650 [Sphingobacterium bovisgrunnientis]|jgi:hypothetical protein|nr:hypothetical protein [Sphingobacterium bovisgrunnientis]
MKAIKTMLLFLVAFMSFTGCGAIKSKTGRGKASISRIAQFEEGKGTFLWSQYDATRRGSVMYVTYDGRIRVLSENAPDAALQSITEITGKLDGLKGDIAKAEAMFKTQKSIAELGKRTAAVNMLRDALYRLNEIYYATAEEKKNNQELLSSNTIGVLDDNKLRLLSSTTISEDHLKELFTKVIDNAKLISIEESLTERKVSESESAANIEKSKEETKRYESIITVIQKMKDDLTKEEAEKYLKQINKN